MVTHDRNEALALGDRVAVIIGGQIRQTGKPHKVFASPADEAVAAFVGVENIVPGTVIVQNGGVVVVSVAGGETINAVSDLTAGIPVVVCLRPEDITLTTETIGATTSARNHFPGKVVSLSPSGAQTRVHLDCGIDLIALITSRSCQELGLTPGKEVTASFKATSVHLIPRR